MPTDSPTSVPSPDSCKGILWSIGLVSAGTLAFEIALMRVLLVASWHHFAFLVISVGLLGFGLSGTLLLFARQWLVARHHTAIATITLLTAMSMPLSVSLAQHMPIEARFLPALFWRQVGWWLLFWTNLTIPFLLGATAIGLGLMTARANVATVYAANLLGSAAGVVLVTIAMWFVDPAWLASLSGAITLLGVVGRSVRRCAAVLTAIGVVLIYIRLDPPRIRPDPFKYSVHLARLQRQGEAQMISRRVSPRAVVEVYSGKTFHELPFLALGATPPPIHALVIDGHWGGSILDVASADANARAAVEQTMMSVPYDLLGAAGPDVLLLGERGGANIWLAAGRSANRIDAVQPDPRVTDLLRRAKPTIFDVPGLRFVSADPRHFVQQSRDRYDLIQLVSVEGSAAGSSGIAGLGQDHLITVEGLSACLERLKSDGLLTVCRGIQTPPRDNLKLFATVAAALRRGGIDRPDRHVVIVRDYLAVCTVVRAQPWSTEQIARVREVCRARQLTPVWFDGIRPDELNQPDAMAGPAGSNADWYHHAAVQLFQSDGRAFVDQWLFDIRPPTDDRPYFLDFCRLRALGALQRAFGDMWLTRAELAYLFVLAALAIVALVAAVTLIFPLLVMRDIRRAHGKWSVGAYFGAIGLAYLLLEIALLSRLTQLIGDPTLSASVTIATFLLGSGCGSLIVQRATSGERRIVSLTIVGILCASVALLLAIGPLTTRSAALPETGRIVIAILLMLPPSLLMGMPMPAALRRLGRCDEPGLMPWAWGVNGFGSVLAAPLGVAIGMTWGFSVAIVLASLLYAAAAALFARLPGSAT